MTNPQTDAEWRDAVNAAEFLLLVDSARQYGLIQTDMQIDVARCQDILDQGRAKGVHPDRRLLQRPLQRT
jgi:hypothetical protein